MLTKITIMITPWLTVIPFYFKASAMRRELTPVLFRGKESIRLNNRRIATRLFKVVCLFLPTRRRFFSVCSLI